MCRCASVFNPAMFCETVRMFMVAMVHGPFGFRFGFSALFRNSEFEFRKRNREATMDIRKGLKLLQAERLLEALLY